MEQDIFVLINKLDDLIEQVQWITQEYCQDLRHFDIYVYEPRSANDYSRGSPSDDTKTLRLEQQCLLVIVLAVFTMMVLSLRDHLLRIELEKK